MEPLLPLPRQQAVPSRVSGRSVLLLCATALTFLALTLAASSPGFLLSDTAPGLDESLWAWPNLPHMPTMPTMPPVPSIPVPSLPSVDSPLQHFSAGVVEDGGHSIEEINKAFMLMVGGVLAATCVGFLVDVACPSCAPPKGRPGAWLIAMLMASYCLLIPGVCGTLFSFALAVKMNLGVGQVNVLISKNADTMEPGAVTESMVSVIDILLKTSNYVGALLVILFAFGMPGMKVVLIICGEVFRYSNVGFARKCVKTVQFVSKWACPDMFAYIMFLYLLRVMPEKSSVIDAPSHLDVGFTCFSVFCISSTFSSLWLPVPGDDRNGDDTSGDEQVGTNPLERRGTSLIQNAFRWLAPALGVFFAIFIWLGMTLPCMGLRVHPQWMVVPIGYLPTMASPLINKMDLASEVDTDVKVYDCILALVGWAQAGASGPSGPKTDQVTTDWEFAWPDFGLGQVDCNCLVAVVILAIFAIALPILDMVCLMVASCCVFAGKAATMAKKVMSIAHVLHHISMLGPMVLGIMVICFGGSSYKKQGVEFTMEPGLWWLLGAEIVHYVSFYTVEHAVGAH